VTEYTKGPWSWERGDAGQWFLKPGVLIAESSDGTPGGDGIDRSNARLIAAAPDLLEALRVGIIPKSTAKDGGAPSHSEQVRCADMCRDAIAKARQS